MTKTKNVRYKQLVKYHRKIEQMGYRHLTDGAIARMCRYFGYEVLPYPHQRIGHRKAGRERRS